MAFEGLSLFIKSNIDGGSLWMTAAYTGELTGQVGQLAL